MSALSGHRVHCLPALVAGILLLAIPGSPQAPAPGPLPPLRIDSVTPYPPLTSPAGQFPDPLLIELTVSTPSEWGEIDLANWRIEIDGRNIPLFKKVGLRGSTGDGRAPYRFRVYPGEHGLKRLKVTCRSGDLSYSAEEDYNHLTAGNVIILDRYPLEFLTARPALRLVAYFVTGLRVTLNGKPVALRADRLPSIGQEFLRVGDLDLEPGWNLLEATWTNLLGNSPKKELLLYYAPNGQVITGEPFWYRLGEFVPREDGAYETFGPYYQLEGAGDGVRLGNQLALWYPTLDRDGWLNLAAVWSQLVEVTRPGRVALLIGRQEYRTLAMAPGTPQFLIAEP